MNAQWIKSPAGRRVLEHWADPRPTWLWSGDGQTLIWRNTAARLFHGRAKCKGDVVAADAVPIRGQIARLIRLGSMHRSSLSRMQFLVGEKPVSATCACMPLPLPDGQAGLLVVGVDPVAPELLDKAPRRDPLLESLLPPGIDYLVVAGTSRVKGGTGAAVERFGPTIQSLGLPAVDEAQRGAIDAEGMPAAFTRLAASPQGMSLLLFDRGAEAEAIDPDTTPQAVAEPLLPMGLPPLPASKPELDEVAVEDHWVEPLREAPPGGGGLSSLFDRLLDDGALFEPLRADEDFVPPEEPPESFPVASTSEAVIEAPSTGSSEAPGSGAEPEPPALHTPDEAEAAAAPADAAVHFRIVGRGFTPVAAAPEREEGPPPGADEPAAAELSPATIDAETPPAPEPEASPGAAEAQEMLAALGSSAPAGSAEEAPPADGEPIAVEPAADSESVERVSRYNFDELSRILNDRVGNGDPNRIATPFAARPPAQRGASSPPEGALVTLSGETLVLNRLPLGILVFRDQQVLFANRAITEMIGYESVESLRTAGLSAIFPAAGDEAQEAGPVNHLVQRDGTLVPVTARLQSVSWQGKPALMLSASSTEVRTGHEAAVRAFAELLATSRQDGFIEASRSGMLTLVSGDAQAIIGREQQHLLGRPVSILAAPAEGPALREFLERPARFAETARPAITVKGTERGVEILLFAQGQAGIVSGYFGFVRRSDGIGLPALGAPLGDADPALLGRISRGVRRPLNTVIGFSDLIGSAAFGRIENERYLEYARDIKTAGLEIAALVDELDDFARLRDGRYAPRPTDIDLVGLLESSVARVRGQANTARVLVRSAISERLPRIRADRASLAQAVLNLLASAIDQTPPGGSVVLSAQLDDAGGIVINVRDSANNIADFGERFVVFRDGLGRNGEPLTPVRSSVGLALTRSLLAVNATSLTVDPAAHAGTLFSITIPPESIVLAATLPAGTP